MFCCQSFYTQAFQLLSFDRLQFSWDHFMYTLLALNLNSEKLRPPTLRCGSLVLNQYEEAVNASGSKGCRSIAEMCWNAVQSCTRVCMFCHQPVFSFGQKDFYRHLSKCNGKQVCTRRTCYCNSCFFFTDPAQLQDLDPKSGPTIQR